MHDNRVLDGRTGSSLSLDTELTKESQKPLIVNTSLFTPRSRSYQSQFNKRWQELGDLPGGCLLFCIERMSVSVKKSHCNSQLYSAPPAIYPSCSE